MHVPKKSDTSNQSVFLLRMYSIIMCNGPCALSLLPRMLHGTSERLVADVDHPHSCVLMADLPLSWLPNVAQCGRTDVIDITTTYIRQGLTKGIVREPKMLVRSKQFRFS